MTTFRILGALALAVCVSIFGQAPAGYQKPPQPVLDVLNAPVTPDVSLSPDREHLLLVERQRYPSIAELAQPMLPLAGLRINPKNNGPHSAPGGVALALQNIASGKKTVVKLPAGARFGGPVWSPDGQRFSIWMVEEARIELWVGDVKSAKVRRIPGLVLNAAYGGAAWWLPDGKSLLCRTVPEGRGEPPVEPGVPTGPNVQESFGKAAPARTYQDLLKSAHDEALFDYYVRSQLVVVDAESGRKKKLGAPGMYASVEAAPGGEYFLVSTLSRPFSRLLPAGGFAREVAIWDKDGKVVQKLASLPSQETVPIEGVLTGPRGHQWRPTSEATLVWAEALDGGDPKKKVEHRDRLMMLKAPFKEPAVEWLKLQHRYSGITWGEREGMALVSDYDRDRRWERTFLLKLDRGQEPKLIWDRSVRDRYGDPGTPLMRTLPNGERVIWQSGDSIFLAGQGASARGDYPFLDRLDLETLKNERIFKCDDGVYESVVSLVKTEGAPQFITRRESQSSPGNYLLRTGTETKALTEFADPAPQLRKIMKQLVTYKRADGVTLSFTLYLPPDYKAGTRLPTVVWAYPLEYNDAATASQVTGSTNRFTTIGGMSHLFFLLQGYAVLDNATMPIVGTPEKMNDTFIEQIVASAQAAIDKAVEMGVTDRNRVGVGGHSYGAFMTANLLAHCDLFKAGIARSGAYNRSLTPFGFQGERRTIWEAPETYTRMSPFMHAQKINEPILLIHGEKDNNPGTFPVQSERLFHAIKGNGGNVRYVTLPHESHGYVARESIEHTLYEMISWLDAHVKGSRPVALR